MGSSGGGDLSLRVILKAQDLASGTVKNFGSSLVKLAGAKGPLLSALLAISAAAIGVGAATVQAAANWQSGLTSLVTGAGEAQSNLGMVSAGMLQLATDTGTSTQQLIDGMYMIESGGYHGAAGLAILKAAAEGAKVGNADLGTVADATDTVLKNFGQHGLTAAQAVNTLIATVSHGKTTMQALSSALSGILPTASAVGVSLNDTAGAMSTMTGEGIPAAQAATFLRQTLLALNAPTVAASRQLKDVGLTTQQVSSAMKKSLPDALKLITDAVGKKFPPGSAKYIAALKNIAGGSKNLQGILALTGTHLKTFQMNVGAVSDSVKKGGSSINGWSLVQQNFNQKMAQAREAVEVLGIKIGSKLLPVVSKIAGYLAPAVTWLTNLASAASHNQVVMAAIGGALVGFVALILMLLVPAFIAWATVAAAAALETLAATWPFILAAAIIAAVVAIIILAVQHWGQIVDWLKGVWGAIAGFFSGLWSKVVDFFKSHIALIIAIVTGPLGALIVLIVTHWSQLVAFFQNLWKNIVGAVQAGLKWLLDAFLAPFRAIGQLFQWLYNHNTYFKKLIDTIRRIVMIGLAFIRATWDAAIKWLVGLWNNISGWASSSWNKAKQAIMNVVLAIGNWEIQQWNKATSWLTDKWNSFAGLASKAWQAVSGVFASIWSKYIAGPLGDLWNRFINWFGQINVKAVKWGENLIQGFIKGIQNMLGQVGQTAQNVASTVAKFLGFHSPAKEGEGRYIVEWGSNMLKGFGSGVVAAIPLLQAQVALAMKQGTAPMQPPALASSVPSYGRPPTGNTYNNSTAGGYTHNGDIVIQGAGQNPDAIANAVMQKLNSKYRRSGVMGNLSAGGRSS